eukprot:TRINITY_DN1411_c0_g2_i2.p1 TRINITY_DN1411_c0_g2~~TRINITY_DN1411_c0_g2_i2.p1  ORF type:complete len:331 (+),score=84.63 TRINITY_DN1411_c0_g2_i2:77-1069(+)
MDTIVSALAVLGGVSIAKLGFDATKWILKATKAKNSAITDAVIKRENDVTFYPSKIRNTQGLLLKFRKWIPKEDVKGIVVMCHGFCGHSNRYEHWASTLNQAGFSLYMLDHQGHGLSEGDRCYVTHFEDYISDLKLFVDNIVLPDKTPQMKLFIQGYSMGGAIAIETCMRWPYLFDGIIGFAPAVGVNRSQVPPVLVAVSKVFSKWLPHWKVKHMDESTMTHDENEFTTFKSDPLNYHEKCYARVGEQILTHSKLIQEQAHTLITPILILHGDLDLVCPAEMSKNFIEKVESDDKNFVVISGGYHDLLHESKELREVASNSAIAWMTDRL